MLASQWLESNPQIVVVRKLLNRRRRAEGAAPTDFVTEWRGLLVLSVVSATIALLFSHLFFGALGIAFALIYMLTRRQVTRGALAVIIYSALCLALGLAINRYL